MIAGPEDATVNEELPGGRSARTTRPERLRALRFQVTESLYRGEDHQISLVTHRGYPSEVVIKRPVEASPASEEFLFDEFQVIDALENPNIVRALELRPGANPYFIMEYVAGVSAEMLIARLAERRAALPPRHVVTIGLGIASALHYIHTLRTSSGVLVGLQHGNVAPSNVLLGWNGTVKLADFGVCAARLLRGLGLGGERAYQPPEALRGDIADVRGDLYGLGVILYELATGDVLFTAPDGDVAAMVRAILDGEVPRADRRHSGVPAELSRIIHRLIERDPKQRYQCAEHVCGDLADLLRALTRHAGADEGLGTFLSRLFHQALPTFDSGPVFGTSTTRKVRPIPRRRRRRPQGTPEQPVRKEGMMPASADPADLYTGPIIEVVDEADLAAGTSLPPSETTSEMPSRAVAELTKGHPRRPARPNEAPEDTVHPRVVRRSQIPPSKKR